MTSSVLSASPALLDRITHHVNILKMNGDSEFFAQSRARKPNRIV